METEWIGDATNGVEMRGTADGLDELIVHAGGHCVVHMEQMSDVTYWFGIAIEGQTVLHMNISSKNLRSYINATCEQP